MYLRDGKFTTISLFFIAWGIFILIVLLGAGNGLKNGVTSNFSSRATNTVQMWPGNTSMPYKGLKSGRSLSFKNEQIIVQGDYRDKIMEFLKEKGFGVKRVGG